MSRVAWKDRPAVWRQGGVLPVGWSLLILAGFFAFARSASGQSADGLNPFAPKPAAEPPALNPFAPRAAVRDDAVPGYVTMSDGSVYAGHVFMTRDKRLKIWDEDLSRQREVPLRAVKQIECRVVREWMEKEWRFKELALDEKYYTGREYPAREYVHVITLHDGRTITGPLAELVYVQPPSDTASGVADVAKFILHKRDKGDFGETLKSLTYVSLVKLGEEAMEEGRKKAGLQPVRPPVRTDDRTQLQGVWEALSMEADGRAAPDEVVARMRFTFEGDSLLIRGNFDDDREQVCQYTIEPEESPKHLTFTPPGEARPILAIYDLSGDRLRVCIRHASSDAGRPERFSTRAGDRLIFIAFQRQTP